jgi:sporulation protein YlmC with PRC-barrel domain
MTMRMLLGAVAVLAAVPALSALAQTPSPAAPEASTPPAATQPDAMPPAQRPATPSAVPEMTVKTPIKGNALVGLAVFSSDGSKLGAVRSVALGPDGGATVIYLKTGGFLGFGGKIVAIPQGKFTHAGDIIQISMTADEVNKLPEAEEKAS